MSSNSHAAASAVNVDLEEAHEFLRWLDSSGTYTFQTFSDRKGGHGSLIRVLHGTFEQHSDELRTLNEQGAGIFVMVNEGDGVTKPGANSVRTQANVVRVRAAFIDLDGAPLDPVLQSDAPPHMVVESSPGRWHAYWRVSDCGLEQFRDLQKLLAHRFAGDVSVNDLPRVLRLPGFFHRKGAPFMVRINRANTLREAPRPDYCVADLRGRENLPAPREASAAPAQTTHPVDAEASIFARPHSDGERTQALVKLAGIYTAKGLKLAELLTLARDWNSRNQPPLADTKLVSTCESIQRTHTRNHPEASEVGRGSNITPLFPLAEARIDRFVATEPPQRRWLLDQCLPQGKVGALIAPGGTGKSQFLLQLGVSVATGEPFLGWSIPEPGGVLCIFAEDDDDEIHRRLHRISTRLISRPDVDPTVPERLAGNLHVKSMVAEDNLMTVADRASHEVLPTDYVDRLALVANEIPDLKLIVIDPGSRFRGGEENSAQDTTRFVEALERLARATGANVIVAHHANKGSMNGGEATQASQRGSSAFSDGVRWQMNLSYFSDNQLKELRIKSDEKRFYLAATVVKNNYGPPGEDLILRRQDDGYLVPAELAAGRADPEEELFAAVRRNLSFDAKAGRHYSRASFEASYGGEAGPLKIGKERLRKYLKKWVEGGKLSVDRKKRLILDASMASRSPDPSNRKDDKSMH